MANGTTSKWLTACLHYNEPWEEFLVKAVKPYIDVVMQTGVAERFFFQRSWERGPHIRIWFKGNTYILETMLKPNLREHFLQYFESRPSLLVEPLYPQDFPDDYQWYPNNSVQYFEYEPELERLGGRLELSLFEKQFQASSELVLSTLKDKITRWTYNEMIGSAVKFHLSLAYSVGMGIVEASSFFKLLFNQWVDKNTATEDKENPRLSDGAVVRSFQKIFELQRKDIVPYHSALWELFKNYRKVADEEFINWFHVNANLSLEIDLAMESGKLKPRTSVFTGYSFQDKAQEQRWNYCEEFIRLTNNRLGIHNKNEGYLYYVMAQSLHVLTAPVPNFTKVA